MSLKLEKSKAAFDEARRLMPGGVNSHIIDGNDYIDSPTN